MLAFLTGLGAAAIYYYMWIGFGQISILVFVPFVYVLSNRIESTVRIPGFLTIIFIAFAASLAAPFLVPLSGTLESYLASVYSTRLIFNPFPDGLSGAGTRVQERAASDLTAASTVCIVIVWLIVIGRPGRQFVDRFAVALLPRRKSVITAITILTLSGLGNSMFPNVSGSRQSLADILSPVGAAGTFLLGYLLFAIFFNSRRTELSIFHGTR